MNGFLSIGCLQNDHRNIKLHCHDFWEIVYYTKGKGINHIGGLDIPFEEGCIICQPPGISHSEESEEGFRDIYLFLQKMDNFGMEIPVFYDSDNREIKQLFMQMFSCYHLCPHNWENIIHSILNLLMEYLISRCAGRVKNRYVEMFENIIAENISNCEFSLIEALESVPVSSTYFMKLFKKEIGYTPRDYLEKKRVEHAERLLLSGNLQNLRIKDIARLCGFHDPYYFSRVFKKQAGLSPKLYIATKK